MKKIVTILAAMVAMMMTANAQVGANAYPASGNVYVASQYDSILSVYFDEAIAYTGVVTAQVKIGRTNYPMEGQAIAGQYGVVFPLGATLQARGITNSTSFTVSVPSITLGYFTREWVTDDTITWEGHEVLTLDSTIQSEQISASYMYLASMPTYTITPGLGEDEWIKEMDTTDFTITITSSQAVTCSGITFTSGSWFNSVTSQGTVNYVSTTTVSTQVNETMWDLTELPATLSMEAEFNINGYALPSAYITYQYGEAGPAAPAVFTGTNPEPDYCDAADLNNDYWMMNFLFSGEVTLNENLPYSAVVEFYDANGLMQNETINIPTMNMWAGENWMTGGYSVDVPTYPMPATAVSVTYTLIGVSNVDGVFDPQPSVTYYVQQIDQQQQSAPRSAQLGASNGRVDVYSIKTGAMVRSQMQMSDVKNLPTGIYIVKDGEKTSKIFVR